MADYYVNTATGSDETGDGSSGNPWKTWDHAASQFPFTVKCEEMYQRLTDLIMIEEMYLNLGVSP